MKNEFVSDLELPNQYFAKLVCSKDITGDFTNIECPELPENYSFFSAQDIPGKKNITIFDQSIPVFAEKTVEYPGQAVGILVGPEKEKLNDLANTININFKKQLIPASEESFENQEKSFFDFPIMAHEEFKFGNPDEQFETGKNIIYSTMRFEKQYPHRAEPASIRIEHSDDEELTIYIPAQWPSKIQECTAAVLNVPLKSINITLTNPADTMNALVWYPILLSAQVAVVAHLTKKNIALDFSRIEDFLYTAHSPGVTIQHKSVINEFEKIVAMNVSIIVDAGAYNPLIKTMVTQMVATAVGIYYIPNFYIEANVIKTGSGITSAFKGWGENYTTSALEKHINDITLELNLSPVQWRLENINHENIPIADKIFLDEDFPFTRLFKAACNSSDFHRKYHAYKFLNNSNPDIYDVHPKGIGIASGLQYNGSHILIKNGVNYSVEVTLTTDNQLQVKMPKCSANFEKILRKVISKKLNLDDKNINIIENHFTAGTGIKTIGTSMTFVISLIEKCCNAIEKQRFRKPLPITVSKTYKPSRKDAWTETFAGRPFFSETPGVCVIELELDMTSYNIVIKEIWLACAPGIVFTNNLIINKVKNKIETTLSSIFTEYDQNGNLTWRKILDIQDIPKINVFIVQDEHTATKYKAVDNIVENLVPAAYLSALNQIFIKLEENIIALPVTRRRIFELLKHKNNEEKEVNNEDHI